MNLSIGHTFNSRTVVAQLVHSATGSRRWSVKCICGHISVMTTQQILRGSRCRKCWIYKSKHGHAGPNKRRSRTYRIWSAMDQRCTNPNAFAYHYYGGRGIKICERWLTFANFLADMGECPPGLTIERINNNGNYEPLNCKWDTRKKQALNRRTTQLITVDGITDSVNATAIRIGIGGGSLVRWIKRGYSPQQIADQLRKADLNPSNNRRGHGIFGRRLTWETADWIRFC
jgi:hypothetical protein